MQLYLIIYIAGLIGGVVGPLPFAMEECERRAAQARADPSAITPGGFSASDVRLACEWHTTRPESDPNILKLRR
jgi:hypothetical protein